MQLSITDLHNIAPESIWIEITPTDRLKVEQEINNCPHSNQIAKYHAYLNRLSLYGLQTWLQAEVPELASQIQLFPSAEGLAWIWEIVNGTAFDLGQTRLVIIPSDLTDTEELNIPQEWIDLPNWVGNYYLAVQVDDANDRICIWGYIAAHEVKTHSRYDEIYRNYRIDREYLHTDLELLWLDCNINTELEFPRESVPVINNKNIQKLLAKLATTTIFSPRLDLGFSDLVKILDSPKYLQELYDKRNGIVLPVVHTISNWIQLQTKEVIAANIALANDAWWKIEDFLNQTAPLPGFFAIAEKIDILEINSTNTEEENINAIKKLYSSQKLDKKISLPSSINSSQQLLRYLMQHTADETLRWKAAEYLWTISPSNNEKLHRRIKHLELAATEYKFSLMVAVIPLLDRRYAVLYRIESIDKNYLPPNVQLTLLSEDNKQLAQAESRLTSEDIYIQLYFTATISTRFSIRVSIDNAIVTEFFAV